jgi:hypothetical protein
MRAAPPAVVMDRRQVLRAGLGLLAPAAAAAFAAPAAPLVILRTGDLGGWAVLSARAGSHEGLWVIDTGATSHVVDPAWARAAGLASAGRTRLTTITGTHSVALRELPPLQAGDLRWPGAKALELDLAPYRALTGVALAGVLGMPLWDDGRVLSLNLAQGRLEGDEAPPPAEALELDLRFDDRLPVVELSLGGRASESFLLDTGNPGALVVFAHRAAGLLGQTGSLPRLRVQELGGGTVEVSYALLDHLLLGGRRIEQVPVVLETGASARRGAHFDRLAGSLGTALFENGVLRLAPRAGRLAAGLAPQPLPGGFGFALGATDEGPRARQVIESSPAARAGVRPSDLLIAIDDVVLASRRPADVWALLRQAERARLRWQRGERSFDAALARERFFPPLR